MIVLEILFLFYTLLNIPAGAIVIAVQCCENAEYGPSNFLFWPLLVSSLREKLNIPGTIIATTFISIFFAPAITLYFISGSIVGLIYLACTSFVKLFKRRNT